MTPLERQAMSWPNMPVDEAHKFVMALVYLIQRSDRLIAAQAELIAQQQAEAEKALDAMVSFQRQLGIGGDRPQ
jgi:hypothetical protein